jgi:hypothetical protein
MSTARTVAPAPSDTPGVAEWVGVALLCACAVLSALLELLFVGQFYIGTMIVPVVVIVAIVGNVLLPVWGFRIVHRISGAVLPVLSWLIPILVLSMYTRPEGDLFVIAEFHQQWVFYGLLLLGAGAGFATVVVLSGGAAPRRPRTQPPAAPHPSPRPTGRSTASRPAPGARPGKPKGPRVNR